MSFTRKHYEETARIIREACEHYRDHEDERAYAASESIGGSLALMFASDNPRFDAERFAKACEPGSGK